MFRGLISSSSSSCSEAVKDCFSFDGDVIGDALAFPGGVEGLPITVVGDPGEEGLRNGEDRGELNFRGEAMFAACCTIAATGIDLPINDVCLCC